MRLGGGGCVCLTAPGVCMAFEQPECSAPSSKRVLVGTSPQSIAVFCCKSRILEYPITPDNLRLRPTAPASTTDSSGTFRTAARMAIAVRRTIPLKNATGWLPSRPRPQPFVRSAFHARRPPSAEGSPVDLLNTTRTRDAKTRVGYSIVFCANKFSPTTAPHPRTTAPHPRTKAGTWKRTSSCCLELPASISACMS